MTLFTVPSNRRSHVGLSSWSLCPGHLTPSGDILNTSLDGLGCFLSCKTAALSGLAMQGFTEKGNKQLEKQEAEKPPQPWSSPHQAERVPGAALQALSASGVQTSTQERAGQAWELLARQLPQEHSPLPNLPVAVVMGSYVEYARPGIWVQAFSCRMGQ